MPNEHPPHIKLFLVASALVLVLWSTATSAQTREGPFDAGGHIVASNSGEFDEIDIGVGGRFGWRPVRLIGIEAEVSFYPSEFPDTVPFSRSRVEGLFGVTVGPTINRVRPFARFRPGFLTFREAPRPFACILIFPPPLSCSLGAGETVFALDVGGGVEVAATSRTFFRVDVGDRLLRYPGPTFDSNFQAQPDGFVGHDFRFAAGVGVRF